MLFPSSDTVQSLLVLDSMYTVNNKQHTKRIKHIFSSYSKQKILKTEYFMRHEKSFNFVSMKHRNCERWNHFVERFFFYHWLDVLAVGIQKLFEINYNKRWKVLYKQFVLWWWLFFILSFLFCFYFVFVFFAVFNLFLQLCLLLSKHKSKPASSFLKV